jgi:hypothetical protein
MGACLPNNRVNPVTEVGTLPEAQRETSCQL